MIRVITGPPCSGKSTYIREHAAPGDLIVDYDDIVEALGGKRYEADGLIRDAAVAARKSAIMSAMGGETDAWIVDTVHKEKFSEDEEVIELDPGQDICIERAKADERPQSTFDGIEAWYSGKKGNTMEKLYKSFDIKADEGTGTITGYFSTYDQIPDSYGDVVAPGAFTETIKAREETGHPFPLCWNHDLDQIIGKVDSIEDTEKGPLMTASFFDTPLAQEKREIVKSGVVYQFSFAFGIQDQGTITLEDGTKANELRKLDLYEVSIVPIPANQNAVMTDVKAEEVEEKTAGPEINIVPGIWDSTIMELEVEEKSGRRNSKADADKLELAIALIQDVLGQLAAKEQPQPEDGEDDVKANGAPEEPESQSNPRKDALLEVISKYNKEIDYES